jgi:hypothetical protein
MKFEDVANAITSNENVMNNALAYMHETHYPDLSAEDFMANVQPTGREPIYVTDKKDPRLRAYNDSLSLYNKYKNKDEYAFGESYLDFKDPKEKAEYNILKKKEDNMYKSQNAELEKLESDPNFRKLSVDEQIEKSRPIYKKYASEMRDIGRRVGYLMNQNTVYPHTYTKKWFEQKNPKFKEKGIAPVSWDKQKRKIENYQYSTTENQYGVIAGDPVGTGGYHIDVSYSPNFKKPVQPVKFIAKEKLKKLKPTETEKPKETPMAQETKKAEPKADKQFYQGRQFMEATGLRPDYYTKEEVEKAKARQDSVYRARVKK